MPGSLELVGCRVEFLPRLWWIPSIQTGFLEGILVDIKRDGGAVEGERQHVAFAIGVIARHRWQIAFWIERLVRILHQLVHRFNRTFGGHHGCCADFKHLQDVRRIARTIGGDRGGH